MIFFLFFCFHGIIKISIYRNLRTCHLCKNFCLWLFIKEPLEGEFIFKGVIMSADPKNVQNPNSQNSIPSDNPKIPHYESSSTPLNVEQVLELGLKCTNSIPPHYQEAYFFFQISAMYRNSSAHFCLGNLYERGLGVQRDEKTAVGYYQNAILLGNKPALYRLGRMYIYGIGVQQNYGKAIEYLTEASKTVQPEAHKFMALNDLGLMYENGLGVPKDLKNAAACYHESASLGYALAIVNLCRLYNDLQNLKLNGREKLESESDKVHPDVLAQSNKQKEETKENNMRGSAKPILNVFQMATQGTKKRSAPVENALGNPSQTDGSGGSNGVEGTEKSKDKEANDQIPSGRPAKRLKTNNVSFRRKIT
jgi:TPR repeat protein